MNNKQIHLLKIVRIVVDCCATEIDDKGSMSISVDDIIGPSRAQNCVMTRAILVGQIIGAGYSTTTCAQLLKRTEKAIRHLQACGDDWRRSSRAYRIADAEATLRCRDLVDGL